MRGSKRQCAVLMEGAKSWQKDLRFAGAREKSLRLASRPFRDWFEIRTGCGPLQQSLRDSVAMTF